MKLEQQDENIAIEIEDTEKKLEKLAHIINELQHNRALPPKNKNHKLKGNYVDCWECHIEPDWLLIYKLTPEELILVI
ncbi:hypothetical protein LCGC14_1060940 [marine sediment metagenome]|uniref:Uncharacterized protein n=1 Tax=marine sediment metagenome TaxID=412755 RepID=A0A0F9QS10_9ZZZZ